MSDQIEIVDAAAEQKIDRDLLAMLQDTPSDETMHKFASANSNYIKRRLRENAFSRKIIPHTEVDDSRLQYIPGQERPVVVEEMEPDSPGAVSLSFNDAPDTAFYRRDEFMVVFCKISTPEFTKNVDELRTTKSPLRQIITDNSLKDIQTHEDERFIQYVDKIVGAPGPGIGASGEVQNFTSEADIGRDAYIDGSKHLMMTGADGTGLPVGVFLTNRVTGWELLKFGRDEAGGDLSEDMFKRGLKAIEGGNILGIPHLFTIKRNLVPDNVVYQFTEPDSLGRAYILQNVRMFVKKENDILRFYAQEKIGLTIANVAGAVVQQYGVTANT